MTEDRGERRGARRVPLDLRVKLEVLEPYEGYVAHARDMSESGIFVGTREKLELGQQIRIIVDAKDDPVALLGEVVRVVRPIGAAIRFVEPDIDALRRLNTHLRAIGKGTKDLIPIDERTRR